MPASASLSRMLDEVDRLLRLNGSGEGVSVAEIMERSGRGSSSVRDWLRAEVLAGRWEMAGRRRAKTADGRVAWTPVYRPVNKRKK